MPEAATAKVALVPWLTVWLSGWVVMVGGTITASTALALVALPAPLATTTE